ncbi:unnamed protein product [Ophioblennius macclurei]
MSPSQAFRVFITQKLSDAAAEIVTAFEQTVFRYEEELARQRSMLGNTWRPVMADGPQQHASAGEEQEEEAEPRPVKEEDDDAQTPQIKEEVEEVECHQPARGHEDRSAGGAEGPRPLLKPEADDSFESEKQSETVSDVARSGSCRGGWRKDGEPPKPDARRRHDEESASRAWLGNQKNIRCDICGKGFRFSSQVQLHRRIHTGEKPHSCQVCGKRFVQKQHLKNHAKIHTGEKPYACHTCGKSFSDQGNFLVHLRTHTGERPYSCQTCDKTFTKSSTLKCHAIIHTGEKPFCCPVCGKRFIQKQHLKKHSAVHTGERPHLCVVCGRSFTQQGTLMRHMKSHAVQPS